MEGTITSRPPHQIQKLLEKLSDLGACLTAAKYIQLLPNIHRVYENTDSKMAVWFATRLLGPAMVLPIIRKAILFHILNFDRQLYLIVKDIPNAADLLEVGADFSTYVYDDWRDLCSSDNWRLAADGASMMVADLRLQPEQVGKLGKMVRKLIPFEEFVAFVMK